MYQPEEWSKSNHNSGCPVDLVPITGNNEDFTFTITPVEIEAMKDASRDIRFQKIKNHLLQMFNNTAAG